MLVEYYFRAATWDNLQEFFADYHIITKEVPEIDEEMLKFAMVSLALVIVAASLVDGEPLLKSDKYDFLSDFSKIQENEDTVGMCSRRTFRLLEFIRQLLAIIQSFSPIVKSPTSSLSSNKAQAMTSEDISVNDLLLAEVEKLWEQIILEKA